MMMSRGRSTSPGRYYHYHRVQQESQLLTPAHFDQTDNAVKSPEVKEDIDIEPIRLSKFSGGYEPDPDQLPKIESLDWPAPPYPAAVPELRARSRSSSNRRAPSTVTSVRGDELCIDDEDDDTDTDYVNDQEVQLINDDLRNRSHGASSVVSSVRYYKTSRPQSKLRYQNKLFDNDYDDYMLRFKTDKEWKRTLEKSKMGESANDFNNNESHEAELHDDEEEDQVDSNKKANDSKLEREMQEMEKIKNESGMAAELLNEVKVRISSLRTSPNHYWANEITWRPRIQIPTKPITHV